MARRMCCLNSAEQAFSRHSLSGSGTWASDLPRASAAASHIRGVARVEESGDDREVLRGVDCQEAGQAFGKTSGSLVAEAGLEPKYQAGISVPTAPAPRPPRTARLSRDRPSRRPTGQGTRPFRPPQGDDGRRATAAQILRSAPDRLERTWLAAFWKTSGSWCSILSRAWTIAILARQSLSSLSGLTRNRSKAASKSGASSREGVFAGNHRRRRDDQIRPVAEAFPQFGLVLGGKRLPAEFQIAASLSSRDARVAMIGSGDRKWRFCRSVSYSRPRSCEWEQLGGIRDVNRASAH